MTSPAPDARPPLSAKGAAVSEPTTNSDGYFTGDDDHECNFCGSWRRLKDYGKHDHPPRELLLCEVCASTMSTHARRDESFEIRRHINTVANMILEAMDAPRREVQP